VDVGKIATPPHWRKQVAAKSASWRFLGFVQHYDGESNCFPSMHTSVSTLAACLAWNELGPVVVIFPLLIAVSCVFTKQHYLLDLPAGAVLGWVTYQGYLVMV
jgi:membrane-associated phospholipid phosphatase